MTCHESFRSSITLSRIVSQDLVRNQPTLKMAQHYKWVKRFDFMKAKGIPARISGTEMSSVLVSIRASVLPHLVLSLVS